MGPWGFPDSSVGKEFACNAGDLGSIPGLGRSLGREKLPISVFWSGEFHRLYSPWGHKESATTEGLSLSLSGHLELSQFQRVSQGGLSSGKGRVSCVQ